MGFIANSKSWIVCFPAGAQQTALKTTARDLCGDTALGSQGLLGLNCMAWLVLFEVFHGASVHGSGSWNGHNYFMWKPELSWDTGTASPLLQMTSGRALSIILAVVLHDAQEVKSTKSRNFKMTLSLNS